MYLPPNDVNAEKAAIGSVILARGGNALRLSNRIINAGMFYDEKNKLIYHAMCKLGYEGIDQITIVDKLRQTDDLMRIGVDQAYLFECLDKVGHADHIEHYCKIIARTFYDRKIGDKAMQFKGDPTSHGVEEIRKLVLKREELESKEIEPLSETLHKAVDQINNKKDSDVFKTGFPLLDASIDAVHAGELNVIGASTNRGKSVILANMALYSAQRDNTIYFGTEMSAVETINRMIPMSGGPAAWRIRKGLDKEGIEKYLDVANKLSEHKLAIIDNPEPSLDDVERSIESFGARVVFLDYLERFQFGNPKEQLRLRIAEFMKRLKTIARRHNIVVYMAAQLNRSSYGKDEGESRPSLSQLSESSSVEKESDRVFLIWSPSTMNTDETKGLTLELIIAKNRHGKKGIKMCLFMDYQSLKVSVLGEK